MSIRKLNPYLNFNGTADRAIQLYESALGATTESKMGFGDMPGATLTPEQKKRIMHATVRVGEGVIMISDTMPDHPAPPAGNVHVCLDFGDAADMTKKFDALSAGGKVTMPLQDTFWGAKFGMLIDAYGISWMFNCEATK